MICLEIKCAIFSYMYMHVAVIVPKNETKLSLSEYFNIQLKIFLGALRFDSDDLD